MKNIYPLLFLITIISACSPYGYVNQMPVEPMFTQKNEGKINAAAGFNHAEIQAAYSLTNNIGISTNQYFGENKVRGYTAGLHLYYHIYRSFYIGIQGGFGENKLEYNNTRPYRRIYDANIYYTFNYLEPTMYFVEKIDGSKISLTYRVAQNNYNNFYFMETEYVGVNGRPQIHTTYQMLKPQTVLSQTFLFNYEKPFKEQNWFWQLQMGFTLLGNLSGVHYNSDQMNVPTHNLNSIKNNYKINFSSSIVNLTFGHKF